MRSDFSLRYLVTRVYPTAVVSIAIGIIAGILCLAVQSGGDFLWHLRAARNLIAGAEIYSDSITSDPYQYVPYPLPAAFLALPVAWLRDDLAAAAFFGASAAIVAWCLIRAGEAWRLNIFLSWQFLFALINAQSTPLLLCLYLVPSALPLVLVKPNIAIPVALTKFPSKHGLALTLAISLTSLALYPTWPLVWFSQLGGYQGVSPILVLPFGPLIVLVLLRWQNREAWLLILMAVMPQRMVYDQIPLLLTARTPRQLFLLVECSWIWTLPQLLFDKSNFYEAWPQWVVLLYYFPALAIVLWNKAGTVETMAEIDPSLAKSIGGQ
ncbi:MAG TPA: hypothetical protein VKN18_01125 [Blastocatellia bacterium]|nr:hypothetical protein [Blastocatellia bacterium]